MTVSNPLLPFSSPNPNLMGVVLAPAFHILDNYIRNVRRQGPVDDSRFVLLGVYRVLSHSASGRDYLQHIGEVFGERMPRSSFFDSLHQRRRLDILANLNREIVLRNKGSMPDLLESFPALKGVPVFAVDGHHVGHAVHSPDDHKGEKVSANNLYLLCQHSGLMWNLGAVQGGAMGSVPYF